MSDYYDKLHKYEGDVAYEVWRHGGNPDAVSSDRCENYYDCGMDCDHAAGKELEHQCPRRQEQECYPEDNYDEGRTYPEDNPSKGE